MSVKEVQVTIKGQSALLMHAFPMTPLEAPDKKSDQEQAEHAAYRDPDTKELFIPGVNIQRSLIAGASYSKGKGRSTLQKPAAACLIVDPERVSLGVKDYSIDKRPVVIKATQGRILRVRPRLDAWSVSFTIKYDDTLLKESEVRRIIDDSGSRVGLLDFRPEKKGPFGRFMVTEWKS